MMVTLRETPSGMYDVETPVPLSATKISSA